MAEIGLLHGNKESFPQAVLEGLNRVRKGCCRFLCVDALHGQDHSRWGWDTPIIFDLFSGQMPFLKEALNLLAHDVDRTILNCPKLARLHNRATLRQVAVKAGLQTPLSLLLPARAVSSKFPEQGFVNLRFPLAWEELFSSVGSYPYLQALDFDRQPGVTVEDLGALWRRYNETGTALQELVEAPKSDELYRVFAIGNARFVRPLESLTRQMMEPEPIKPEIEKSLIGAANALLNEVPWSVCSFDLGLTSKGVEYLDSNPDPYLEWWVLGEHHFSQAVEGAVDLLSARLQPVKTSSKSRKKKGQG